jgi:hypothetical protein
MVAAIISGIGSVLTFIGQALGLISTNQAEKNTPAEIAAQEAAAQAAAEAAQQKKDDEAITTGDITNI